MKKRFRKKYGWALTKKYPHKEHFAHYKRVGKDDINYITFTHSASVEDDKGNIIKTIKTNDNISPLERAENLLEQDINKRKYSYAMPRVFVGKRSALGKEVRKRFSPIDEDVKLIDSFYNDFEKEYVYKTSNSEKYFDK